MRNFALVIDSESVYNLVVFRILPATSATKSLCRKQSCALTVSFCTKSSLTTRTCTTAHCVTNISATSDSWRSTTLWFILRRLDTSARSASSPSITCPTSRIISGSNTPSFRCQKRKILKSKILKRKRIV